MATISDDIDDDTDNWTNFTDGKSAVEHLNSLRNRLTADLATKLCEKSYPIHSFSKSGILYSSNSMKAYLQLLYDILPLVPRSTFLELFPKGCGGCAIYQLYAIAFMHPHLDGEVRNLLKALLMDEQEWVLSMIPDVKHMARMIRQDYKRHDHLFPYVANCLDLRKKNQESKIVGALGAMVRSEEFLDLMEKHDERVIRVAKEMIDDDKETSFFSFRLSDRLKTI